MGKVGVVRSAGRVNRVGEKSDRMKYGGKVGLREEHRLGQLGQIADRSLVGTKWVAS